MYTFLLCTSVGLLAHNNALKSTDGIRSLELPSLFGCFVCVCSCFVLFFVLFFCLFFNPVITYLRHVIFTVDEAAFMTK